MGNYGNHGTPAANQCVRHSGPILSNHIGLLSNLNPVGEGGFMLALIS